MATSTPPMYSDAPLALIHTPQYETGTTDAFTIEASHMALSHNAFIRGFNSIYQQAPRVTAPADQADFVGYCIAWHDCVKAHHDFEETEFFPNLNKATGKKGLMDHAVDGHAAFHDGMSRFKTYLSSVSKGGAFSGAELIHIMDSFKDPLYAHLKSEPGTIVALARHSTPERPVDILGIADRAGKKQVTLGFVFNVMPVFLLNMDTVEFEDGMWHGVFPPFKDSGLGRWILMKLVPLWRRGQWRVSSYDGDGRVKALAV
ncbi:hypothetical protein B0T19DRAFT_349830 [Cercophora scortea]|uniref:Hemerythrin-like domain-containing protein n=1 Tax=Cercophora scortea TaxID=314031 RepID=A0AAE0MLT0_9PEZI|nr:hypothetical protein B0T19DRAFT_349830 [Cercophora scortea]